MKQTAAVPMIALTRSQDNVEAINKALRNAGRLVDVPAKAVVLAAANPLSFFEIALSPEPAVRRWQRRREPVHHALFEGLYLTRDISALLEQGGFRIEHLETGYMARCPESWSHCCWGTATPRAR